MSKFKQSENSHGAGLKQNLIILGVVGLILAGAFYTSSILKANAQTTENRIASGYAWSDNIGWISFNGTIGSGVVTCTPASPLTQTLLCSTGQEGSITQTRTSTCSTGATSPVTSDWATTSNTCTQCPQSSQWSSQLDRMVTWEGARSYCTNLGGGWRLPSQDELMTALATPALMTCFQRPGYWSSNVYLDYNAWLVYYGYNQVVYSGTANLEYGGGSVRCFSPTCTASSYIYSALSPTTCPSSGQQTRTVTNTPDCSGGVAPVLTQSCTYTPPVCTASICTAWGPCSAISNTKTCTNYNAQCSGSVKQTCTPTCVVRTKSFPPGSFSTADHMNNTAFVSCQAGELPSGGYWNDYRPNPFGTNINISFREYISGSGYPPNSYAILPYSYFGTLSADTVTIYATCCK